MRRRLVEKQENMIWVFKLHYCLLIYSRKKAFMQPRIPKNSSHLTQDQHNLESKQNVVRSSYLHIQM